jgi:hypothetical protein
VFWVISAYFNIRNTLPKSGTFLLGHPVCTNEGNDMKHYLQGCRSEGRKRLQRYSRMLQQELRRIRKYTPYFKTQGIWTAIITHNCRKTTQKFKPENCVICSACMLSPYRLSYSDAATNCRHSLSRMAVTKRNLKRSHTRNHKSTQIHVTVRFESIEIPRVSKTQVYRGTRSTESSTRSGSCRVQR